MFLKKIFSVILLVLFLFCYTPLMASAADDSLETAGNEPYKATVTKTGVNEDLRKEAYDEYAALEAEYSIDIVPMFKNWETKKAFRKVNNVGNKILVANHIDDFARFEVSRKLVVNATTSFNGTITLYKGLLNYVEREDELAYVIGHELGHITYDDTKKGMIRRGVIAATVIAGSVVVGANTDTKTGMATAGGLALAGSFIDMKFSRGVEARADRVAIDYMVKAGYNPMASISMMNKIMNRRWDFASSHPGGDKRMIMAYQYITKKYPKYVVVGFDTIAYERGMSVINKKLAKDKAKQVKKENKKHKNEINVQDINIEPATENNANIEEDEDI